MLNYTRSYMQSVFMAISFVACAAQANEQFFGFVRGEETLPQGRSKVHQFVILIACGNVKRDLPTDLRVNNRRLMRKPCRWLQNTSKFIGNGGVNKSKQMAGNHITLWCCG